MVGALWPQWVLLQFLTDGGQRGLHAPMFSAGPFRGLEPSRGLLIQGSEFRLGFRPEVFRCDFHGLLLSSGPELSRDGEASARQPETGASVRIATDVEKAFFAKALRQEVSGGGQIREMAA